MGFRIKGLDTPIVGVSWEYTDSEKKGIQQLFDYLETKRLLINPIDMENKDWCISSVIEIKNEVYEINAKFDFQNDTKSITKKMLDACNTFLDGLYNVKDRGNDGAGKISLYINGVHAKDISFPNAGDWTGSYKMINVPISIQDNATIKF